MTFKELNLSAPLLRAVQEAGYETPSPIQASAIPPVLEGRDLMGCAQTGTGKTAAFALPMLDRLTANAPRRKGAVRALILTPTRELALQIGESFEAYGKYLKLRSTVIFGGVGQAPQVEALKKGVDILIACPGRLNDLIGQGFIDLSALEIFVLDEADRMLDMGFVHDVKKVIAKLPAQRQNLMFSATMPAEIEQLAAGILRDPAFVKVDPVSSTVDRIQQSLYYVEKGNKDETFRYHIARVNDEDDGIHEEPMLTNEDLVLGIRPEFLSITGGGNVECEIYGAMPTGMESTVKVRIGEYLLTGVVFGSTLFTIGSKHLLDITGSSVMLFDRSSGRRITSGTLKLL